MDKFSPRVKIKILTQHDMYDGSLAGVCLCNRKLRLYSCVQFGGAEPIKEDLSDEELDNDENWVDIPRVFAVLDVGKDVLKYILRREESRVNFYQKYKPRYILPGTMYNELSRFERFLVKDTFPDVSALTDGERCDKYFEYNNTVIDLTRPVGYSDDTCTTVYPIVGYSCWGGDDSDVDTSMLYGKQVDTAKKEK